MDRKSKYMKFEESEDERFDLFYLVNLIRKYAAYVIIVVGIACLLSIILTMPFFYPPEFRSSAIIYPTNPERFDLDNVFAEDPLIYLFGDSKGVERLDNIANSEELQLYIIDSLDLWKAYRIDKDSGVSPRHYALLNFNGNVTTLRVAGDGLQIEAFDHDPERAAAIVNLLIDRIDYSVRKMITQNKEGVLKALKEGEDYLSQKVDTYRDSITAIRGVYNVYHIERQTEAILKELLTKQGEWSSARVELEAAREQNVNSMKVRELQTRISALESQIAMLTRNNSGSIINLEQFRNGLDKIKQLELIHEELTLELKENRKKINNLERMSMVEYSTIITPEKALPADRKSKPIRWIILLATGLISSLVSIVGLVLIDRLVPYFKPRHRDPAQK